MDLRARVIELNETRMKVWEEGKRLLDDTAGKEMSAEERQTWDRINVRLNDIDAEVRSCVDRETRETEAAQLREASNIVFGEHRTNVIAQTADQQLRQMVQGAADGQHFRNLEVNVAGARKERELLRQGASPDEIRVLAWDTGNIGSAVPVTMARSLYEYLEAGIAAFRIGAQQINTSTGESMEFPTLAAHGIATQVSGQGTALAGTDPGFGKITMNAFKYGQLVVVSSEALRDPVFDVAGFLGRNIGRALARKIDTDLVVGTGSGQPMGMMTAAITGAAGTVATGGTVANLLLASSALIDTVYAVNDEYRQRGAWLMRDATAGAIRKIRADGGGTIGQYLWEPSLTNGLQNGQPDRLLGFPVYTDPNVASLASNARIAAFGDFSTYYLRTVGNVQIDSSTERYFDTDQVGFRGKWQVDGEYVDLTGVVLLKNSVV
jgi:HK97 family phage major capsid protein